MCIRDSCTSVPALLWKCMAISTKNSVCCDCSHLCTACIITSLDLSPSSSLSGPNTWKSLSVRSGEYKQYLVVTKTSDLGWLQVLHKHYSVKHCYVATKYQYVMAFGPDTKT